MNETQRIVQLPVSSELPPPRVILDPMLELYKSRGSFYQLLQIPPNKVRRTRYKSLHQTAIKEVLVLLEVENQIPASEKVGVATAIVNGLSTVKKLETTKPGIDAFVTSHKPRELIDLANAGKEHSQEAYTRLDQFIGGIVDRQISRNIDQEPKSKHDHNISSLQALILAFPILFSNLLPNSDVYNANPPQTHQQSSVDFSPIACDDGGPLLDSRSLSYFGIPQDIAEIINIYRDEVKSTGKADVVLRRINEVRLPYLSLAPTRFIEPVIPHLEELIMTLAPRYNTLLVETGPGNTASPWQWLMDHDPMWGNDNVLVIAPDRSGTASNCTDSDPRLSYDALMKLTVAQYGHGVNQNNLAIAYPGKAQGFAKVPISINAIRQVAPTPGTVPESLAPLLNKLKLDGQSYATVILNSNEFKGPGPLDNRQRDIDFIQSLSDSGNFAVRSVTYADADILYVDKHSKQFAALLRDTQRDLLKIGGLSSTWIDRCPKGCPVTVYFIEPKLKESEPEPVKVDVPEHSIVNLFNLLAFLAAVYTLIKTAGRRFVS